MFRGTKRFRPVAFLGRGSKGLVYRVYDDETGTEVALKTLDTRDPDQLYHLKQEFRVLVGITHPNLVELYELIVTDGECFFTMEFVDGVTFVEHVRRHGDTRSADRSSAALDEFRLRRFVDAARQLVLGVSAVHAAGRLHRDIKPANILVTETGRVVLLDFGLATALGSEGVHDTFSQIVAGTLAYMAPEQAWGRPPNPASDWYSVGVVLYETLIGRLPFTGPPAQVLRDKTVAVLPAMRALTGHVPDQLEALVRALLSPEPGRRPDAGQIIERLQVAQPPAAIAVAASGYDTAESPFVGRAQELAKLRFTCGSVQPGAAAVVHIHGPSGIGKTELVRRFLSSFGQQEDVLVLRGRCHPRETMPYKGFDTLVDSLSRFLVSLPEVEAAALVPRHAAALVRLFPVLGRVPAVAAWADDEQEAEPYEVRRRGFGALRELLARIADRRRLILWIDDLQWSDLDSASLLRELLRFPDPPGMALLLSYRSEDRNHAPVLATLRSAAVELPPDWLHEILLGPLDFRETHDLVRALGTAQPGFEELVPEIASESGGSPFFIGELVREVAGGSPVADEVPSQAAPRLQRAMNERVQRLPITARQVLEVVSIAGGPLDRGLALSAVGVGEAGRPVLSLLEQAHFLRSTSLQERAAIEVYHDRIREMVIEQLTSPLQLQRHAQLADALAGQPEPDPAALFRHCLGAGRNEQAGEWAAQAADRAAAALAFVEAAELYRQGLELKQWPVERATVLRVRRADALVNAGHGADAAPIFLSAAPYVEARERLDLRRRAAEQYLLSGHMEQGTTALRDLLRELSLRVPRTSGGAVVGALGRLLFLWLSGIERRGLWRAMGEGSLDQPRIEACHAAAKGLFMVDPVRALYFAAQSLTRAGRGADLAVFARELASVGAAVIPAGSPMTSWGARLVDRARAIADELGDPYLRGFTAIAAAQISMSQGRWRQMLDLCDQGAHLLRERCRGVTWELDVSCGAAVRALEELGNLTEMSRRAEQLFRDAEQRGDLYGLVTALATRGLCQLAGGRSAEAREAARRVATLWMRDDLSMQHFYSFRLEAYSDICEGRPQDAWNRVKSEWPAIGRSGLLRHLLLRTDAHLLRARAALAVASSGSDLEAMLHSATDDARRLAREGRPDTAAHSLCVRAGVASVLGDHDAAVELLRQAARGFQAADMALCLASTRQRTGELIGGDAGRELLTQANEFFDKEKIAHPAGLLRMYAPGFAQ